MGTFDVRIWGITTRKRESGKTYEFRWAVAGERRSKSFKTRALAEAFRAKLLTAAREGAAFDEASGLPEAMIRDEKPRPNWYQHACVFVDMKWPKAAGKSRAGTADSLATVTLALIRPGAGAPADERIRTALYGWAFNASVRRRADTPAPADVARTIAWVEAHCLALDQLDDPAVMRRALDRLARKMDGSPTAASTVARKRAVFHNALEYAVELGHLPSNPLGRVRWKAPQLAEAIDRRVVVNPSQAEALIAAVAEIKPAGPHLVAFFACMYYAGMRPGEVVKLRRADCTLPDAGWGALLLSQSAPAIGSSWSDGGTTRDSRQLKHRSVQDIRPVPAAPPLVEHLRAHIQRFGVTGDGLLFRGQRGGPLSDSVYGRVWQQARSLALTADQVASPLAGRPYDLRHAAVSLWLNGGVAPQQVAEWAGHSVNVLLRVYAKCLDGEQAAARRRIETALGLVGPVDDSTGRQEHRSTT